MSRRKHIVITKLFEFGGSNSHLQTLIQYLGKENIILVIEDEDQLQWCKNIAGANELQVRIVPHLHKYAHLVYPSVLSNIKEALFVIRSVFAVLFMSIRYGSAHITICSVEPEKYLYLLWVPFKRVIYILHTVPVKRFTRFTTYTCNTKLGPRKQIITVSNANKDEVCDNWNITPTKQQFVQVVYNCLTKDANNHVSKPFNNKIKHIVTMGHVIAYKNPHLWFDAAKRIIQMQPDVHFTWLGNGPLFEYFSNATQSIKQVDFVGFKSNTKDYLASATLYYQPSTHETHGIAVVEAMSHGLPCIVANAGGLPESVKDNYNGFLASPYDVEANVKAIIDLINDEEMLNKFGTNSYKRYLDLFTFEKFRLKMNRIYN